MFKNLIHHLPVISQAKSFSELARNATNVTNPWTATASAVKLIVDVCAPPQVKHPVKCTIFLLQVGICVSTGGFASVTTAALTIGTAKQILEEVIK